MARVKPRMAQTFSPVSSVLWTKPRRSGQLPEVRVMLTCASHDASSHAGGVDQLPPSSLLREAKISPSAAIARRYQRQLNGSIR
jgi:hypothetical protein